MAAVTLFVVVLTTFAVAALRADEGVLTPEITQAPYDAGLLGFAAGAFVFAGGFAALGLVIVRTGALPEWLGWLAGLTAIAVALRVGGVFTTTGAFNVVEGLFGYWLGIIGFLVWTLIASVVLVDTLGRGGGAAASAPGQSGATTQRPG